MQHARDLMQPAYIVKPDAPVATLAARLVEHGVDGACVLHEGRLVGVVTSMDLIYREKAVHLPTFFVLFEAVIPFGQKRAEEEMARIAAIEVRQIMSKDPTTIGPDAPADAIASQMVDGNYSMLPVIDGDTLVGVVTRNGLLRHLASR